MMHYESTTVVASWYVITRGEKRDCLKQQHRQEFSPWHHRPVWKAQRNMVLSPCVSFLVKEMPTQKQQRSESEHIH